MKIVSVFGMVCLISFVQASEKQEVEQRTKPAAEDQSRPFSASVAAVVKITHHTSKPLDPQVEQVKKQNPFVEKSPMLRRKSSTSVSFLKPQINMIPEEEEEVFEE